MHTLLHLIIAHLLADFVFQSNDLVREKQKKLSGHVKHAGLLAFFTALAVLPFWHDPMAWIVIALVAVSHFFQDQFKIYAEHSWNKKNTAWPFFLDQILHLAFIAGGAALLKNFTATLLNAPWFDLYRNEKAALFILFLILLSFALEVLLYQIQKNRKSTLDYHRDYKDIS